MRIGTVRAEEARVFDGDEGTHVLHEPDGSLGERRAEVFFHPGGHMVDEPDPDEPDAMPLDEWRDPEAAGWYASRLDERGDRTGAPDGPHAYSWQAREAVDVHAPTPNAAPSAPTPGM